MSRKTLKRINCNKNKYVLGDVLGEGMPRRWHSFVLAMRQGGRHLQHASRKSPQV